MNELSAIKQFIRHMETEFDVKSTTLYKNDALIIGSAVDSASFEYYQTIPQTTVFRQGNSSTFVTMLFVKQERYMIILASKNRTAFDGLETTYIIDEIKKLGKRLGEFE